jgi:transposase
MTKPLLPVNAGVDVSKDKLDIHLLERDLSLSVPNDEQAIASLVKRLARYRLERIVVEATGRLEHAFVSAAIAKELPVVAVAPLKVRRFAQAAGQLAKTDAIDARLIARFAAALKPATRPAIDANSQIIKDLVVRRRQLTSLRTTEKNRRSVMHPASIASSSPWIARPPPSSSSFRTLSSNTPRGGTNAICSPQCPASALPSRAP